MKSYRSNFWLIL